MQAIILTIAYNAENTISRTIESVLRQTYSDFVYYIVNNGATDKTINIIQEYAQQDSRIVVMNKEENNIWEFFEVLPEVLKRHKPADYLCSLDADDEYTEYFLEHMIGFAKQEKLEVAACGNFFINTQTGDIINERKIEQNLVLESKAFETHFTTCYQFMRTIWGKIYSVELLLKEQFEPHYEMGYGGDTVFGIETFLRAKRVGIFSKSLHKYYVSAKSASYQFNEKRFTADCVLFDMANQFLLSKVETISKENQEFILLIYMNAIQDTINVLLGARITTPDKLANIINIFAHEHTKQLVASENFGAALGLADMLTKKRQDMLSTIVKLLFTLEEVPPDLVEGYCATGELLCAAIEYAEGWLSFKKLWLEYLINESCFSQAKSKLAELLELLPNDEKLLIYAQKLETIS